MEREQVVGSFVIDVSSEPGVVRATLTGRFEHAEMLALEREAIRVLDGLANAPYRVWVDLRNLQPLSPECAAIMERIKRDSARRPNFRGSAVLVANALVSMQHRRTSVSSGVMPTEAISNNEEELRAHLARLVSDP
jgi:hypothetical protein